MHFPNGYSSAFHYILYGVHDGTWENKAKFDNWRSVQHEWLFSRRPGIRTFFPCGKTPHGHLRRHCGSLTSWMLPALHLHSSTPFYTVLWLERMDVMGVRQWDNPNYSVCLPNTKWLWVYTIIYMTPPHPITAGIGGDPSRTQNKSKLE